MVRVRRFLRLVLAGALAAAALPAVLALPVERIALAEEERAIAVGTELVAVTDVTLHQAEISKGSRVSVTKVELRDGKLDGVSVALADGHVVKLPMTTVHTYFQVADD
jgi:ABC-type amino acid transport substrate-binding protein